MAFASFLLALAIFFGIRPSTHSRTISISKDSSDEFESSKALPLLGLVSGGMSGIFTVGAGLVVVPVLVTFFRMSQTKAQGIALALVVPGAVVALGSYAHAGYVNWHIGIPLALGGMLSISWGVGLAHKLPPNRLRMLFCCVLALTAIAMLCFR